MAERPCRNLLVEIGTEELPPKALRQLGESFGGALFEQLHGEGLVSDPERGHRWFATPRRLAVLVPGVRSRQLDREVVRRGPAVRAAFTADGKPTKAALGFARSCQVAVEDLERLNNDDGEWLVYRHQQKGRYAADLVPPCVAEAVKRLPIPKRMRWGDLDAEFVRPVHWLVMLHGKTVIKTELLAVRSGSVTYGHRFHHPARIKLSSADDYARCLTQDGKVIPDFAERRKRIHQQVTRLAQSVKARAVIDEDLLDEVTGLVEWPQALLGEFDSDFLQVPAEALVSSMRDHQKYFHLVDESGRLQACFITVSNIRSSEPRRVRSGNERVLRARLSDARFFWETDLKRPLADRCDDLEQLLFHRKLGSVADKSQRLRRLCGALAAHLGVDAGACDRAALLAKADLVSSMVGEFPELQGTMGRYYALHDKEDAEVAVALEEHYRPRFAGDALPTSPVGCVVAVADRVDSLVGIFAAGEEPSGDKDPYGLRRAALGILRIIIEGRRDIDLTEMIDQAIAVYRKQGVALEFDDKLRTRIFDFVLDRLRAYYAGQGFKADEIAAVVERRPSRPLDFDRRLRAVARFRELAAAENLAAANKRIRNILRKAGTIPGDGVDEGLLTEAAERELASAVKELSAKVAPVLACGDYAEGLTQLASLREPVDRFFDDVMVMADDTDLRDNRLALLQELQQLFLRVADISLLQP